MFLRETISFGKEMVSLIPFPKKLTIFLFFEKFCGEKLSLITLY